MLTVAMQSVTERICDACAFGFFFMEFRQTKRSVWFQAHGQMDTQNVPGTALTKHTCVFFFVCFFSLCVFQDKALRSVQMIVFLPPPLTIADYVTIKFNHYLISNIVLLLPVSF